MIRTAKKRLEHEAQAASSLDHPNICTIHEINETEDGQLFIAMAFYAGETLKEKIARGPVEISEAISITKQICQGLDKAHQSGIIHRDIKPANIFITEDGIVKILDFGLAKAKGHTQLTKMGTTVGTVAYMSPEQAKGGEVDKRTDIWSTGVVFYEMITGQLPFRGDYDQAVIYSIINTEPELEEITQELLPILNRAFSKSPDERYQSADKMISDLEALVDRSSVKLHTGSFRLKGIRLRTKVIGAALIILVLASVSYIIINNTDDSSAGSSVRKMIVVLPFKNLGPPEHEYFAEGVRDEISNKLSTLASIGVISRSSAEKYAKSTKSAKEIGKELGVDYILEGTIRWAGGKNGDNRVRIISQLVRSSDDLNIWSDSYDRIIDDIFNVQNEIAQNVVDKLGIKILPRQFASESPPTKNLDAYEYYLKGARFEFGHISSSEILKSIRNYEIAIKLDPNFAAAHALLSTVYMGSYFYIQREPSKLEKINSHIQKAKELNPDIAEVHLAQAYYYYYFLPNGLQKALEEFKRVLEIQPNNAEATGTLGLINYFLGNYELRLPFELKAFSLDPLNARYAGGVGFSYRLQRDYKNAEKYYKRMTELVPEENEPYFLMADNYIDWKGDTKLARQIIKNINNDEKRTYSIRLDILDRNFDEALRELKLSTRSI